MMWLRISLVAFVGCVFFASGADAQNRQYQPARPTFSPYLDYFKRDVGALDVYNSIVRPNQNLRSEVARQRRGLAEQGDRIGQLQQQNRTRNGLAPTGTGARFMDFSHYYLFPAQRRPTAR